MQLEYNLVNSNQGIGSGKTLKGRIELYLGPMFGGKTSKLYSMMRRQNIARKKCIVFKHSWDDRYTDQEYLVTHDQSKSQGFKQLLPAKMCQTLKEVDDLVKDYDVIGIDEGQFFNDINQYVPKWSDQGKQVYISALDGDFNRNQFGNFLDLVPKCDFIQKLLAVCNFCGDDAPFTFKESLSQQQVEIGSQDIYSPACRQCFLFKQKEKSVKLLRKKLETKISKKQPYQVTQEVFNEINIKNIQKQEEKTDQQKLKGVTVSVETSPVKELNKNVYQFNEEKQNQKRPSYQMILKALNEPKQNVIRIPDNKKFKRENIISTDSNGSEDDNLNRKIVKEERPNYQLILNQMRQ